MSEHRRETRQRVFLKGRVVFNNGSSSLDCLVRDMSPTGARLVMSEATTLPDAFLMVTLALATAASALYDQNTALSSVSSPVLPDAVTCLPI